MSAALTRWQARCLEQQVHSKPYILLMQIYITKTNFGNNRKKLRWNRELQMMFLSKRNHKIFHCTKDSAMSIVIMINYYLVVIEHSKHIYWNHISNKKNIQRQPQPQIYKMLIKSFKYVHFWMAHMLVLHMFVLALSFNQSTNIYNFHQRGNIIAAAASIGNHSYISLIQCSIKQPQSIRCRGKGENCIKVGTKQKLGL